MFLQCKSVDIPLASLGAGLLACAAGHWLHFGIADLPSDSEFVQAIPIMDEDAIRLFFYHPSFPQSETIESVPAIRSVKIRAAESADELA